MNPYYCDYSEFLSRYFPFKVQKLSIDAALGCPNRDGTIGRGGCIYCSNQAFSPQWEKSRLSVTQQLEVGRKFFAGKYPQMKYLAYFQSYTGTHGAVDRLMSLYSEALAPNDVVGLIIGTRPDCMPNELLQQLSKINSETDKRVFIEYGAESTHEQTLQRINRCHTWAQTTDAVERTAAVGIPVGLHFILGLPGETEDMMLESVRRINDLPVSTVKFHQLQVLKGTPLALGRERGEYTDAEEFTPESYAHLCAKIVQTLRKDIAVERFVAQAPADMLISPRWGLKNYQFTHLLNKCLAEMK